MNHRSNALAVRLEQGARALALFTDTLSDDEWRTRVPGDGRKIGVIVHHVASMYPIEIQLAQVLAAGKPVTGVTWADVHAMTAAQQHLCRRGHPGTQRRAAGSGGAAFAQF